MKKTQALLWAFIVLIQAIPAQNAIKVYKAGDETNPAKIAIMTDTIRAGHLYAIGQASNEKGEVFIWDNLPAIAAITAETREPYVQKNVKNLHASRLLYADIARWDTILIDAPVHSLKALRQTIVQAAASHGTDTLQDFPFLLVGKIKTGEGRIVYRDDPTEHNGKSVFTHPLENKRAQMIGFILRETPGQSGSMEIHFRLQNKYHAGRLISADFDESEPVRLFLPAQQQKNAPTIRVVDTDFSKGRLCHVQEIGLQDLARFHGHLCDGLVEGFIALKFGLYSLYPDGLTDRTNTRIVSKPSPCLTDAALYLSGGRYQYNSFYVQQDFPGMYIVQRIDNGKAITITRKPNVKPTIIDEMGDKAIQGQLSACELETLKKHEEEYTRFLLDSLPADLFEVQENKNFIWSPDLNNQYPKTDVLNKTKAKCQ